MSVRNSNVVFGDDYASAYDLLYRDKDYLQECAFIEAAFRRFGSGRFEGLMDLGCGTGGHALELARRGYSLVGVDRSPHMLDAAKRKLSESAADVDRNHVRFEVGDIETARVGSEFDAAIVMFAVLGYINETPRLVRTLRNIRQQLRAGGLFVADFWYGPAVMKSPPGERVRIIEIQNRTIIRTTRAELDTFSQVVAVHFSLFDIQDSAPCRRSAETHRMRYFFPGELQLLFDLTGFRLRAIWAFPSIEQRPDDSTWNAAVIAEAT